MPVPLANAACPECRHMHRRPHNQMRESSPRSNRSRFPLLDAYPRASEWSEPAESIAFIQPWSGTCTELRTYGIRATRAILPAKSPRKASMPRSRKGSLRAWLGLASPTPDESLTLRSSPRGACVEIDGGVAGDGRVSCCCISPYTRPHQCRHLPARLPCYSRRETTSMIRRQLNRAPLAPLAP